MKEATWIKTDGTSTTVQPRNRKAFGLDELQKMVGGYIQLVSSKAGEEMSVNEEGLVHDLPRNDAASRLIHAKWWTAGGVRGDVVIIHRATKKK